ncbi:MAG: hypothetical protein OEZ22_03095 [Spirochaetia bacterium]|nr:hypothetical protein [Spirochaetia bacterium]
MKKIIMRTDRSRPVRSENPVRKQKPAPAHETRLAMKQRKKNRLSCFDYSNDGLYFITSCTQNRICYFGEIDKGKMILNENGKIAETQWYWLQNQYQYIKSHAFVIMPNHIHAILQIIRFVGTGRDLSLQNERDLSLQNEKIKPLSELIGAYKTTVSKKIHLAGCHEFKWQRSFYDHIIRDPGAYNNIIYYIENNPVNWEEDEYKI